MTQEPDPVRRALSPLRSRRWDRGDHVSELEHELMRAIENAPRRRRPKRGLLLAACTLMLAGAGFAASEWWQQYSVTEEDLGDGTFHLKVTDPDGQVDFDEVLENGTGVEHLEDGGYIVVEPLDDNQVNDILDDLNDGN